MRQYLIQIAATAFICGGVKCMFNTKTAGGTMIRLVTGLVMTLAILSPVFTLSLGDLPALEVFEDETALYAAQTGEELAREEMIAIINQRMESYILDRAEVQGVSLSVSFRGYGENMLPEQVILRGSVSPYAKRILQKNIADDLGIAKENQIWIG